jgi:hypothetical protein
MKMKRVHVLRNNNAAKFYARLANVMWEKNQEQTLILVEEIEQIAMLANLLKVPFTYAHGNTLKKSDIDKINKKYKTDIGRTNNDENIEAFNRGEYKVFIGTSCVSTGTNFFSNHHTCNWQGGSSETATKQGPIGRSVRLLHKSKYSEMHKPRPITTVWDINILGISKMEKQTETRIGFYEETGQPVKYIKRKTP